MGLRGEGERQQKQKQAGGEKSSRVWEEEREGEGARSLFRQKKAESCEVGRCEQEGQGGMGKVHSGNNRAGCPATLGTNSNLMSWLLISLLGVSY